MYEHGDIDGVKTHPIIHGNPCRRCKLSMKKHGWIQKLERAESVCPGDWIMRDKQGELYACSPDNFAENYEPVEE